LSFFVFSSAFSSPYTGVTVSTIQDDHYA
jgi:hypothetical protein